MGKGSMKLAVVAALVLMLIGSWYTMFKDGTAEHVEYENHIAVARDRADKKLYEEAYDSYKAALSMFDSIELREEIADFCKNSGRTEDYVEFCAETARKYPHDPKSYVRMAEYYSEAENYFMFFSTLTKAEKRGIRSAELDALEAAYKYAFQIKALGYRDVRVFSNGLCAVRRGADEWGFTDLNGKVQLGFNYTAAGDYTGYYIAVEHRSGGYALIDPTGREKSKPAETLQVEDCLFLFEDKMAVKYGGKYHYCDMWFNELFGSYDYAGTFSGGLAAVKEGDRWYVIDSSGNKVGEKSFEEIKVDEKGVAFRNGVAFAKENGKYFLIDTSANRVGNGEWADVDCFNSNQPAAVSNGQKWGFIDTAGNVVLDYSYGQARSFSNGFAAVAEDGKWGYVIIEDYSLKIDYQFVDAKDFSASGTVYVSRGTGWDLLEIYSYNQ
ncbi:MAG: hypothetical protein E7619_04925 [Ruminococcaceae bacterium]|nr:hypothetical protein [Oscillospiraceae bacterium]